MNIIVTNNESLALNRLLHIIKEKIPDATPIGFTNTKDCLDYAEKNICQIAFLDIEMRDMDGIELAKKLKKLNPKVNIIFVTAYTKYQGIALSLYVSGYVLKPVTTEKIERELDNLRFPIIAPPQKHIKVKCFGHFDVFSGDNALRFKYKKTKELFAILIERKGSTLTSGELMAILWEDESISKASYFHNLLRDLSLTLEKSGHKHILDKRRGSLAIIPNNIICDYYDWIKGIPYAKNSYKGEFMSQYSWAEKTLAEIEHSV